MELFITFCQLYDVFTFDLSSVAIFAYTFDLWTEYKQSVIYSHDENLFI